MAMLIDRYVNIHFLGFSSVRVPSETDQVVMTLAAFVELFSILAIFLATAPVRTVSKRGVVGAE